MSGEPLRLKDFQDKIEHLRDDDKVSIETAYGMAKYAHRHQSRRQLDPDTGLKVRGFDHPRTVAQILLNSGITASSTIITALLHDGIEDTRFLTRERIQFVFGSAIAYSVQLLTKTSSNSSYLADLKLLGGSSTLLVKLADRLHNLQTLRGLPVDFQKKQLEETEKHYMSIFNRVPAMVPSNCSFKVQGLVTQVQTLVMAGVRY